jgi:hypothetical protein
MDQSKPIQNKFNLKSRPGWFLVMVYLVIAYFAFKEALTCTGWVCDLAALPAVLPLGLPIAWITDFIHSIINIPGHTPGFHFRNWYFIIPTVIANAIFYYWIGLLLSRLFRWLKSK